MPELILVKVEDCLPLRESVLRPGQPPEAWTYATDSDPRALHFAIKQGKAVLGVASLLPEERGEGGPAGRPGRELWRLRGMAVRPDRQGHGFGRMLLQAVQAVAQQRGGGVWCTARTKVEAFYLHYGFVREGEVFDLPGGGPHVLMSWHPPGPQRLKFGPAGASVVDPDDDEEPPEPSAAADEDDVEPGLLGEDELPDGEPNPEELPDEDLRRT